MTFAQWPLFGSEKIKIEVFHSLIWSVTSFRRRRSQKLKKLDFLLITFSPWPLFGAEGAKKLKNRGFPLTYLSQ